MESEFVTVQEAAELLGVTRRKVSRMIAAQELDVRQSRLDKRQRLIPRSQIDEILRTEGGKKLRRKQHGEAG